MTLKQARAYESFLYTIAVRLAHSTIRRRRFLRLVRPVPPPELIEYAGGSDTQASKALASLERILTSLDANRQLAFVLRYVEGHELQQIADMLGWSLSTTKRRVQSARRRVVELAGSDVDLEPYLEGGSDVS